MSEYICDVCEMEFRPCSSGLGSKTTCSMCVGIKEVYKSYDKTIADLRAKLEIEKEQSERYHDELNCKKDSSGNLSRENILFRREREELFPKMKELESQVAVLRGALEEIQATINELGNDVLHNKSNGGWMLLNINAILDKALSVTPIESIQEQEKYTELGRLALTTRATVCGSSDFKKFANRCENHCINYDFCQRRAELLTKR